MRPEPHIYVVTSPAGNVNALSFLPPEQVFTKGLAPEVIVGWLPLPATEIKEDSFRPNPIFVRLLHRLIAKHAPTLQALQDEARRLGDGAVYMIDGRAPTPHGAVDPEDIIGVFLAAAGAVLPESYQANPNHLLLSRHGWFVLNAQLQEKLLEELYRIAS